PPSMPLTRPDIERGSHLSALRIARFAEMIPIVTGGKIKMSQNSERRSAISTAKSAIKPMRRLMTKRGGCLISSFSKLRRIAAGPESAGDRSFRFVRARRRKPAGDLRCDRLSEGLGRFAATQVSGADALSKQIKRGILHSLADGDLAKLVEQQG